MQKLSDWMTVLCLAAAVLLYFFGVVTAFEASDYQPQASTMLLAGSVALLGAAVSVRNRRGE